MVAIIMNPTEKHFRVIYSHRCTRVGHRIPLVAPEVHDVVHYRICFVVSFPVDRNGKDSKKTILQ